MRNIGAFFLSFLFVIISNSLWDSHSITMLVTGYLLLLYVLIQHPQTTWEVYGISGYAIALELLSRNHFGIQLLFAFSLYCICIISDDILANTSKSIKYAVITLVTTLVSPSIFTGEITPLLPLLPSLLLVWISALAARYYIVSRNRELTYEIA